MPESGYLRFALRLGSILLAIAAFWLFFVFALPWFMPFILAMLTARLIEPGVLFMFRRFGFKRSFSAAIFTILVVSALLLLFVLIGGSLIAKLIEIVRELPSYLSALQSFTNLLSLKIDALLTSLSPDVRAIADSVIEAAARQLGSIPAELSSRLLQFLTVFASYTPGVIMFVLTYAIGTYFISTSYLRVNRFLVRQFPESWQDKVKHMKSDMFGTLGSWARSELILMGVTFAELLISFSLLGVRAPFSSALLVAFIDALPVLGTGSVLIPWAVMLFIGGNYGKGAALIVTWGVATLVRSFLEPKILGGNVGLHPAATLLAIYLGYCIMGVKGLLLFPLTLIVLKQFNDKGYVKLWN
jgi:sporulation integral membrane protein YtvI